MVERSPSTDQREGHAGRHDSVHAVLVAAQLYFARGCTLNELKSHPAFAGKSTSTIARIVRRARRHVDVRVRGPIDCTLSAQLCACFRLKDAVVVETGLDSNVTELIGRAAAKYFQEHIYTGAKVALSCGETLSHMVEELPRRLDLRLDIAPLSIEGDPESIEHAPATLVGMLRAKSAPSSTAFGVQLLPCAGEVGRQYRGWIQDSAPFKRACEIIDKCDWIFIGIGVGRQYKDDQGKMMTPSFVKMIDDATSGRYSAKAEEWNVVAEINNQPIDSAGEFVLDRLISELPEDDALPIINLCNLKKLQQLAQRADRHCVVAVAGGSAKQQSIRRALELGYVNVLITDRQTAEHILRDDQEGAPGEGHSAAMHHPSRTSTAGSTPQL